MGDLPKWKKEEWSHSLGDLPKGRNGLILWVTYPGKKKDGEWSHSLGDLPRNDDGLIVMGDLPSGKEEEWSHSLGDLPRGGMASFLWVTYPA